MRFLASFVFGIIAAVYSSRIYLTGLFVDDDFVEISIYLLGIDVQHNVLVLLRIVVGYLHNLERRVFLRLEQLVAEVLHLYFGRFEHKAVGDEFAYLFRDTQVGL